MRKSSFGHRPPRGKPQDGAGRGHGRGSNAPKGAREERRDGAPPKSGGRPFRVRPGKPSGRSNDKSGGAQSATKVFGTVSEPMRIAKAMARAGLCSRREAERWIEEGRVSVNGKVLKTPAVEVTPRDRIVVDGKPLPVLEPTQLWRYYKAKGLVTTHSDPEGRPTVFDTLPPGLPRVISVGRLDFNTEGLILLTNDGELARHLELPATGWLRSYRVRAKGRVTQEDLDRLSEGVEIEGVRYGPIVATIDSAQGANMWLAVGIREGKNREVRKVLSSLGLDVNRLIRVAFGPFELGGLKEGEAEVVPRHEVAQALGGEVSRQFGLGEKKPQKGGTPRPRAASKPRDGKAQQAKPRGGKSRFGKFRDRGEER